MPLIYQLFALQQHDTSLEEASAGLATVTASLGESDELIAARQAVEQAQTTIHQRQSALRELEWSVAELEEKIKRNEEKLYSGRIRNPKELDSYRLEVEQDQKRKSPFEDQVLETMATLEDDERQLAEARRRLDEITAAWQAEQQSLLDQEKELTAQIARLKQERERVASQIPSDTFAAYDKLRRAKRGLAVVAIDRNACTGCRIALPMAVVQRVRKDMNLVNCPSCGRILTSRH